MNSFESEAIARPTAIKNPKNELYFCNFSDYLEILAACIILKIAR